MTGAIRFESEGHGDALVLLPGAACGPSIFAAAKERLRARHAISTGAIAGFAGERPVDPPLYPKLVSALVAHLESAGPAVLVGHSLGGTVALSAALEAPALVKAIVLIEGAPALGPLAHGSEDRGRQARRVDRSHRLARDGDAYVAALVEAMRPMFCVAAAFEAVSGEALRSDAGAIADALGHATTMDLRPRMGEISAPVLLMLGEWPHLAARHRGEPFWAQLEACPRRTRVTIPGTAHFPMTERPDAFVDALERFLADVVR